MASAQHHNGRRAAPEEQSSTLAAYLPAGLVVVFCAIVIWLAVPVFWHSVIAQRSIETINALKRGEAVSTERLIETLEAIGPVDVDNPPIGDRLINQGILTLAIALRLPPTEQEHIDYLTQARALAEARLRRAPSDTHAWARLAMSEYLLNGPSALALEALRTSFQTGPYEYYALTSRLQLGANLWPFLDEEMKRDTATQGAMLWRVQRERRALARIYLECPEELQQRILEQIALRPDGDEFGPLVAREAERRGAS